MDAHWRDVRQEEDQSRPEQFMVHHKCIAQANKKNNIKLLTRTNTEANQGVGVEKADWNAKDYATLLKAIGY